MKTRWLYVYAFVLALSAVSAWSQSSVTSLRGTVADPSGALVPGAQVLIEIEAKGLRQTATTDAKGQYQFLQISPDTYKITVTSTGFSPQSRIVELLVNQPATLNFALSVTAAASTVDVRESTPTLNTADASLGDAVNNATIQALPMEGRNVPDLLSLQPGVLYLGRQVNATLDSRSGAVAGARSDQGNLTLDGVDNNDPVFGYAFTGVLRSTLDSVAEFRVTTANSNADAGRSSGAQVSMVTKSGTNDLHGSVYEYNRNTGTAANNWFNKQAQLSEGLPNIPGKLIRNTFGAALGGPIRKDKLFYFLNYEGQRTAENQQETLTVPTMSLRSGNISYPASNGSGVTLSPTQIATMDPNCRANGTCPLGAGVDPNSLSLMGQYPLPNGSVSGDGLNTASFTWPAPNPASLNTYIAKLDYLISDKHRLFIRGNLQGDSTSAVPQFPGQPASSITTSNSKGIALGETWTVSNSLVNNFHYGFVRGENAVRGAGSGAYVNFDAFSSIAAETRTDIVTVPTHNVVDDVTWTKRNHTIQFGVNYRLIHNESQSDTTSYPSARATAYWLSAAAIANTGTSLDPGAFGYPSVDPEFGTSYDSAIVALTGLVTKTTDTYNYNVASNGASGTLANVGALVNRNFKNNEFESYIQDSWRVLPTLTVTFGLRYTLLQTPYEVNGQQVQPSIDIHQWFETRGQEAAQGMSVQPPFSFAPSGQSRGAKPYWPMRKNDFAPRFAIAYAPSAEQGLLRTLFGSAGQSSIRAGFGMYYDHFGQNIVNSFNQVGSFGLTTTIVNPEVLTPDTAPRFTATNNVPQITPAPSRTVAFPVTPSTDPFGTGFAATNGIDDHLKTPYSYAFDLSIQRELPAGFALEVAYEGRLGRHLLQSLDLGEMLDLVDPASGSDYFSAATQLSKATYAGQTTVAPISYWEDMFPWIAGGGNSATQNIYNLWKTLPGNEALAMTDLDIYCTLGCGGHQSRFWDPQYASLFAWSSIGTSSYNAGQITLRRPSTHGLQMNLSYTYSKSMDLGSDTQRSCTGCPGTPGTGTASFITNSWNPRLNYAVSDFDTRHIIVGDWVYQLPFGNGQRFAAGLNRATEAIVGGWQLSGLARWTSGLPFSIINGNNFSTNWDWESNLVQTGPVKIHKHYLANGSPEVFADPTALSNGYLQGSPVRNAYPGEAGQRNNFRGDGYFGIDAGLAKSWTTFRGQALKFSWEVFNATNSVRFDTNTNVSLQNNVAAGGFGIYSSTLTAARVQQFSLRYSF